MAGQSERDILERLRREFQSQGYTVETQADVFSRADRSQAVRADLSARKGGEVVLVGIKPMGADAGTAARMEALARAAEDNPGWRFRLVVADSPLTQRLDLPEPGVIRERLADVRRLAGRQPLRHGHHQAAAIAGGEHAGMQARPARLQGRRHVQPTEQADEEF